MGGRHDMIRDLGGAFPEVRLGFIPLGFLPNALLEAVVGIELLIKMPHAFENRI